MNDKIFNFLLNINNSIFRRVNKKNKKFPPTNGYLLEMNENFKRNPFESKWIKNLWWGSYAKEEKLQYMDESCVIETPEGLELITDLRLKKNVYNGIYMLCARGNVQLNKPIRNYGAFEVIATIYPSSGVWHAPLWFVAAGEGDKINVLPEIDVAEVYSKRDKEKMKVNSNLHYGYDYQSKAKSIGAKTHYIPNFLNREVSYGITWNEDSVSIYIDGWLVRRITDKTILKRLDNGVIPIIGVGMNPYNPHISSKMSVKSFKYWREW